MHYCIEKLGPHRLGPKNQIKTFKRVVCVYIYINPKMKTKQTKTLKVYTCLLTSQQIRNCIGYTLCKAQSLLSIWNNS